MKVYLTSDLAGLELKNYVKDHIQDQFDVIDLTEQGAEDFVEAAVKMVEALEHGKSEDLGIAFDAYGVGSFIAANKHQGMIVAEVSDERSAYMTRQHNNTKLINLIEGNESSPLFVLLKQSAGSQHLENPAIFRIFRVFGFLF